MKTSKIFNFGLLTLMLLLLTNSNVWAQPGRGMGMNQPKFSNFDKNNDGFISEEEFNLARAERINEQAKKGGQMRNMKNAEGFKDIDQNGDGKISKDEFLTHQQSHRLKHQNSFKNQKRFKNNFSFGFKNFDKNSDGVITKEEFDQARAQRVKEQAQKGAKFRNIQNAGKFESIDLDGDGKITRAEFARHQLEQRNKIKKQNQKL